MTVTGDAQLPGQKCKIQIFLRLTSPFFSRYIILFFTRENMLYDDVTASWPSFFLALRPILTDATNGPFS